MVTIGVDAHKTVHQALALEQDGTPLGHWRGANTEQNWQRLLDWAKDYPGPLSGASKEPGTMAVV